MFDDAIRALEENKFLVATQIEHYGLRKRSYSTVYEKKTVVYGAKRRSYTVSVY